MSICYESDPRCPSCGEYLSREFDCGFGWIYYCHKCRKKIESELIRSTVKMEGINKDFKSYEEMLKWVHKNCYGIEVHKHNPPFIYGFLVLDAGIKVPVRINTKKHSIEELSETMWL